MKLKEIPQMIRLRGIGETRQVFLNGEELSPKFSQRIWNHSPDGFNWGYGGSGPAQLSLAILLVYYPVKEAVLLHQSFKFDFISGIPQAENFDIEFNLLHWRSKYPPCREDGSFEQGFFYEEGRG